MNVSFGNRVGYKIVKDAVKPLNDFHRKRIPQASTAWVIRNGSTPQKTERMPVRKYHESLLGRMFDEIFN